MFGLFKKERSLTQLEKLNVLNAYEERISKELGFSTLTNGRRVRIKLAIASFLGATLALAGRANEAELASLQNLFLSSADTIEKLRISDVFYFPDGYDNNVFEFNATHFIEASPIFDSPNTWTNGRGIMSQILDVYGPHGLLFILQRQEDFLMEASSLLLITLATGKLNSSPNPAAFLTIPITLLELVSPILGKVKR